MKHYIVLERSEFRLDPPSGRVLYKTPSGKPVEEALVRGEEVDSRVPYPLLNPIQTVFFRKYRGGNALVTAPTSAGKSLIAYMFIKDREGRKIYTAPTKSLVYEKVVELRRLLGRKVDVRTGDIIEAYRPVTSDVVVSTYENLALALRNRLPWTQELSCVVIDEIHHLIGSRGWILEEMITYLLETGVEVLGLSATLPGSIKLAKWIRADLFLESFWRPVPLERRIIPLTEFGEFTRPETQDDRMAVRLLSALYELRKRGDQVILFVHKKGIGWRILELADRERIPVMNETLPFERRTEGDPEIAFHNADVPREEREEIEKAFREGRLPVLVATSTLAYGVNLPADTVIIGVRAFYDRRERRWKVFPSQLDILQMEGRAGRLGIKDKGFSYILPYGAKPGTVEEEIRRKIEGDLRPYIRETLEERQVSEETEKVLSLFLLIGYLYEGENFRRFLSRTYSLRDLADDPIIEDVFEWLRETGYIERGRLSEKALFCIRSGMSPLSYEEFLRRKTLGLDRMTVVRPLLFMKSFEGLYDFVRGGETFPEDDLYVRSRVAPCGHECIKDNTHQFIFYIEGLTFKYRNLQHPPGEFSYLGTDVLHLLRVLLDIRSFGDIDWTNREILEVAHSIKYGISPEHSSLGGIKGIGHVRANLLKRLLKEEGMEPPPLGTPADLFADLLRSHFEGTLEERMVEVLIRERLGEENVDRARKEAVQVIRRIENSRGGFLVDDRILRTFGLFLIGPEAIRMRKADLIKKCLD
ncbi:MAG: DEAD/DEAH box helicase [Aquificota bacterium]|nr:DEAD/DEAH box helicase [Aquificota bacterium]